MMRAELGWLTCAAIAAACTKTVPAPDTTPPLVVWTTPQPDDTGVTTTSEVSAVFSESMDGATLDATTFTLAGPGGAVTGTIAMSDDRRAVLTPDALAPNTAYTATITTGAQDLDGNPLAAVVTWTFTTGAAPDAAPPTISALTPAPGSTSNQASTAEVTATFSEPIDCDRAGDTSLQVLEGGTAVPGYTTCDGATLAFHPFLCLPTETELEAFVSPSVADLAGNPLGTSETWSFGVLPWTRQLGTLGDDFANGVATDTGGNVFVTGWVSDTVDGQPNAGQEDALVVAYDATGAKLWTRELGGAGDDVGHGIAVDPAGDVYIAGTAYGSIDGNTGAGIYDMFVAKYDSGGTKQWTRELGTALIEDGNGVAVDAAGDVYVVGATYGAIDGNTSAGSQDGFVTKYDAAGNKQWTKQLGTATTDIAYAVAIDAAGNAYVTGTTFGALDGNTNAGSSDTFLAKYNGSGVKQWTRTLGGTAQDNSYAIAIDPSGGVYITGSTFGSLNANTYGGSEDLFVAKFDPNAGILDWVRQIGTGAIEEGDGITTDAAGDVYITGFFETGPIAPGQDMYVLSLNANGTVRWARTVGTGFWEAGAGIAADAAGDVYSVGYSRAGLDGNASAGQADAVVVKFQSGGQKR